MRVSNRTLALAMTVLLLTSACGASPSATVLPPPSSTPIQPTASPIPPEATATPVPAATPQQPVPTATPSPEAAAMPFDQFLEESYRQLLLRDPDSLIYNGVAADYEIRYDRFTDRSAAYLRETQQLEAAFLDTLRTYDRDSLPKDRQLSYDIYEWYLDNLVRGHEFIYDDSPINGYGDWDAVNMLVDLMVNALPVEDKQDAENYVARLAQIDTWVDQLLEGLRRREQAGVIPPRFLLEEAIAQIEGHLQMQGPDTFNIDDIALYASFRDQLQPSSAIRPADQEALLEAARNEIEQTLIPAFLELREYLIHLKGIATNDAGLWRLPHGDAYYAYLLRSYTGSDVSAEELHEMGLARVAQLQAEMRQVAVEMGYEPDISMAEISQILSEHPGTLEGDALLAEYQRLIAAADRAADDFFDLRPTAAVVVRYDPAGPVGSYKSPPPDGSGPGEMATNLASPDTSSLYNKTVLVHHETIPGHHMQTALVPELDLPTFRATAGSDIYYGKGISFQGYVEGWAVYAQQLGWEMGLYEGNPLENLGRLRLMLHQMARMVIDTGIHAKGWTREEAAAYLEEATGLPASPKQMNRYVAVPGQAIGYNYGLLSILKLRQEAKEQLGDAFDIKEFHNVILGNGPMPVGLLEQVVKEWIQAKLDSTGQPAPSPVAGIVADLQGLPIDEFFEESCRQLQLRDPDALFVNGLAGRYGVDNDRFTDMSDVYVRETQQLETAILKLLLTYRRDSLSPDQQLSYDIYASYLNDLVRGHEFEYYDYPANPLTIWGIQNRLMDLMVNYMPIEDTQDAEDYIARLSQIDTWVDQLLEGLRLREQAGVIPPRFLLEETIAQIEGHLQMQGPGTFNVDDIALYASFRDRLQQAGRIDLADKQRLGEAARGEIERTFIPAFLKLRDYLIDLAGVATDDLGAWKFPDGKDYYAFMLHQQASTDMTPDEVHELGLAEVARIQAEIREVAVELGYPPDVSMAALDAEGDSLEGEALLAEFQRIIAEMDGMAGAYFDLRPSAKLVTLPEPYGSLSYYLPPPFDGSGPGKFFVTMNHPLTRDIIPSFIYHETIPGHHFQGALARELGLPTFRASIEFNAYVEGWASYTERLAWEMGVYEEDPLGNLGRLNFELSRAARLVVDTGIHAKGWTAEQASAYLEEAAGMQAGPSALIRYLVIPGQACGYTIGMLKILELRQQAMDQLGERFDIKKFHALVLRNGPLPLEVLEQVVEDWIEEERVHAAIRNSGADCPTTSASPSTLGGAPGRLWLRRT